MTTCDADGRNGWQYKKWTQVAAIFAGVVAVVVAAALIAGAQLVNSPMATATTTKATPWVPLPIFQGKPAPKPSTSVSSQGNSSAQEANKWVQKANKPFQAINDDMKGLAQAFADQDIPALQAACQKMSGAGQDLAATLPAPKDDITAESQGVVDSINALSSACLSNPPDGNAMQTHATDLQTHMSNLYKLVKG